MTDNSLDPRIHIAQLGENAKEAAKGLRAATTQQKNNALLEAAKALRAASDELVAANTQDVDSVRDTKALSTA